MEAGRIVEQGTHDSLLAEGKIMPCWYVGRLVVVLSKLTSLTATNLLLLACRRQVQLRVRYERALK